MNEPASRTNSRADAHEVDLAHQLLAHAVFVVVDVAFLWGFE